MELTFVQGKGVWLVQEGKCLGDFVPSEFCNHQSDGIGYLGFKEFKKAQIIGLLLFLRRTCFHNFSRGSYTIHYKCTILFILSLRKIDKLNKEG